ncbi:cell division control protein Cdc6 [Moesziomyces antarcticus]|uniref:Cell division control protein Cdc6 n=1 Tax=Pseudozyma antarctica TaxID=84753 RepID=A0A081CFZ1_PSEA2|nr:cell division control protein Cdc6 [Moesziomyces antarcticus]GAK65587.1 cell division control protein Cdc6 [Moesziomyces antarcticus]
MSASSIPRTPSRRLTRTASDQHVFSSSPTSRTTTDSTPTRRPSALSASGRKRSRNDFDLEHADDGAVPASPLSRLRLNTPTTRCHATHLLDSPSSSRISSLATPDELSGSYFPLSSQDSAQSTLFDCQSIAETSSAPTSSCSSDRDVSPPVHAAMLKSAAADKYSSVYAHARALLRYAAGVDPAETEAGLTITGATTASHGANHVKVVGRESERVAIQLFLHQSFGLFADAPQRARALGVELDGDSEAACLYVCGLPGTGKTALVRSVLNSLSQSTGSSAAARLVPRVAFVNCMTLSHPRLIFAKVLQALGSNAAEGQSDAVAEAQLSTLIRDGHQRILIVLDEMDHLLQSRAHQNILYKLFSCANSRGCSLIGIANSLDLTERFVPLLASKGASPALLHFRPFEANEIVSVIRDRLSGLHARYDDDSDEQQQQQQQQQQPAPEADDALPLFTPTAVELLAKKIASATGDLRKALDAARLAVEMVENEQRKKAVAEAEAERAKAAANAATVSEQAAPEQDTAAPASASAPTAEEHAAGRATVLRHLTRTSAPKATPTHILKVLTAVLGSPNLSKVRSLGVHPKLVLLAVLVAQARAEQGLGVLGSANTSGSAGGGLRIADVESTYHAVLKAENGLFSPLEGSELLGVFDMLEVNGVIRISSDVETSTLAPGVGGAVVSSGVSPSGKRAAKKQLLASSRRVYLAMAADDVTRGITTSAPASATVGVANGGVAVAETIARVYAREKDRAVKAKLYHSIATENARIRQEELGGGRMAVPIGSF